MVIQKKRIFLHFWVRILLSAALFSALCGCPSPTTPSSTGGISGHAYLAGQMDNSGILVGIEPVDEGGKTFSVRRSIESRDKDVDKALAVQTTTDSTGVYSFTGLDAGTYTIYACSENSVEKALTTGVTVEAGKDVTAADLSLTPTGRISGTATLDGGAAGNLGIVVFIAGTSYSALSTDNGSFTISSVPATTGYTLVASKDGYDSAITTVDVSAGQTTMVSAMNLVTHATSPSTGSVSGAVRLNESASSNAGVFVYLLGTSCITMTNDAGAFRLTGVTPGSYTLMASREGYVAGSASVTVTVGADACVGTLNLMYANHQPQIQSITVYPQTVMTTANLVCSATDADSDPLAFSWTVGGIGGIATGANTSWNSRGIPGYLLVGVTVTDGKQPVMGSSSIYVGGGSPWPKFRRDLQGTGTSPIASSATGSLKWNYASGASISYSSPAIGADGTVYIGSSDYSLYAIDSGGTLKWSYTTGSGVESSPAIGADGTIYVGSSDSKLYAIDSGGTLKWSYTTGGGVASSPAIGSDGTIYVGSSDSKLYAIDSGGTLKWSYTTGGSVTSSPAIGADGAVYVGSSDSKLYAIDSGGTLKWIYTTGGCIYSSPAIGADGTVFIGSVDHDLYAIDSGGTLKWSYTMGNYVDSSPAIGTDGTIYIGSDDKKLYAIDSGGTLKWCYTTGNFVYSSPAIGADGTVYIGSSDNKLYAINPGGTLKWSYTTGWFIYSSPSIGADGTIYFGCGDRSLYAIK